MIHEILYYLYTKPHLSEEDYSNLFELGEFLHPAEKNLLLKIIEIPKKYHKIVDFIKAVDRQPNNNELSEYSNIPDGLYIRAFACGLQKVLEPYRKEVVQLEQKFLQNAQLTLTSILISINKYEILFDDLHSMIEMIMNENLSGCLLVGKLQKYYHSGNEQTSAAADLIMRTVNVVFFQQLKNWVIYGELLDPHNEFFIVNEGCPDTNFSYPEPSNQSCNSSFSQKKIIPEASTVAIVQKFSINESMIPVFMDEDMVESIFFMGRIIWILSNNPEKESTDLHEKTNKKRDLWDGKEIYYFKKIESLQNQTFNGFEFTQIIEECRLKLSKSVLSLMLEEGNVKEHLQLIREYYALGRGELFQQFLMAVETQNHDISQDPDLINLNYLFMDTATKLYGYNDSSYQRFKLVATEGDIVTLNLWSRIELNFNIKWPLQVIFHPKAMNMYKKLFSYLLRFKKAQMNLHKLWNAQVSGKGKINSRLWLLRHNLMFLVNNLLYYIQVDVIESTFSVLQKAVINANELEDVIKVHHEFVGSLLSKTFILDTDQDFTFKYKHRLFQDPEVQINIPSKIYRVIMSLLELCDDFSLTAITWKETLTELEIIELDDFQRRADTTIELLLITLLNLRKKERGEHLFQLIDQLNFNRYFEKENGFDFFSSAISNG